MLDFHARNNVNGGALCWGSNAFGQLASTAINGPQKGFAALTSGGGVVIPPTLPTVSITAPANNASFAAPASIAITATASANGGATLAKVDFYNGATLLGTATTPPYTFNWVNVPAGNYSLTAKVTDSNNASTTSAAIAIAVAVASAIPTISIATPANNAGVAGGSIIVSGTFEGPVNSGVVVNGVIAVLGASGSFTADVPLAAGSNAITATVTSPTGETGSATVTVTAAAAIASPLSVTVDKGNGAAPLVATFTIANTGAAPASYAFEGNPAVSVPVGGVSTLATTYTQIGANTATFILTDNVGVTVTKTLLIEVRDDGATDVKLRAIWNGMNNALISGNKAAAMNYLNSAAKAKYGPVFDVLLPFMPQIVGSYSSPGLSTISDRFAEYAIRRVNNGVNRIFLVYFTRDADGIWRLDEM